MTITLVTTHYSSTRHDSLKMLGNIPPRSLQSEFLMQKLLVELFILETYYHKFTEIGNISHKWTGGTFCWRGIASFNKIHPTNELNPKAWPSSLAQSSMTKNLA